MNIFEALIDWLEENIFSVNGKSIRLARKGGPNTKSKTPRPPSLKPDY